MQTVTRGCLDAGYCHSHFRKQFLKNYISSPLISRTCPAPPSRRRQFASACWQIQMLQMSFTVLSAGYSHLMNPQVSMNLKDCFGGDDLISQLYIFSSFVFPCNSFHAVSKQARLSRKVQTAIASLPVPLCLLLVFIILP